MSRTYKDEPFWIREFKKDPNWGYVPDDWRKRTNWRWSDERTSWGDTGYWERRRFYDEWRAALPSSPGQKRYANWADSSPAFSQFRKDLNRSYRAKVKQKIKAGRYDEIDPPVRNARWFWW